MITVINDLHIGAQRQAGTTPKTQALLKQSLQDWLYNFMNQQRGHVVANGDLFDSFSVDVAEVIKVFDTFANWLMCDPRNVLTMIAGNHDWSPKADRISSFHLLCHFLASRFPTQLEVIDHTNGFTRLTDTVWAIGHMPNQDLFNLELQKAIDRTEDVPESRYLLLHANCKNNFAENSDHSLNVGDEHLGGLMRAGWTVVFAHEHQSRTLRGGRVVVVGNQIPSSISDCLDNETKYYLTIDDGGCTLHQCWSREESYAEVDWRDLSDVPDVPFVRVTGTATADQAADVVGAVAKLRQSHASLVIGNAVRIEGMAEFDALAEMTFDDVSKVDVLGMLLEELNEREQKVVKELLNA